MKHSYTVIIERGIDGYLIGSVLELPGCRTQAMTYDELLHRMEESIALYQETEEMWSETPSFLGIQQLQLYA